MLQLSSSVERPARRTPRAGSAAISFIVPVKDQLGLTRALVESVRRRNPEVPVEWVIVDSGSTDGTGEYCRRIGATVVPYRNSSFNYCAAINAGAEAARGELLIVANNDVEFRSAGDLGRLLDAFRQWPLLSVISPGEPGGDGLEFGLGWLYGPCWAVRASSFAEWGGLPECLSGYGYDEAHSVIQCWRRGEALGWLGGWDVFHHGGQTFGPLGGNTSPVLRRNLSRLLAVLGARDLDSGGDRLSIVARLRERELAHAAARLLVPGAPRAWLERQGYSGARRASRRPAPGAAYVCGSEETRDRRQWLPWLANELLLQPGARIVGAHGWYAVRDPEGEGAPGPETLDRLVWEARAVGPLPPALPPVRPSHRPTPWQRLAELRHDWRHRRTRLPAGW